MQELGLIYFHDWISFVIILRIRIGYLMMEEQLFQMSSAISYSMQEVRIHASR